MITAKDCLITCVPTHSWLPIAWYLDTRDVTAIATAMVLLYRFYCISVYHVLIILDLFLLLGQL